MSKLKMYEDFYLEVPLLVWRTLTAFELTNAVGLTVINSALCLAQKTAEIPNIDLFGLIRLYTHFKRGVESSRLLCL